jgi:S1-C subfamily serine protease
MKISKILIVTGAALLLVAGAAKTISQTPSVTESEQRQDDFINAKATVVKITDSKREKGGGTGFVITTGKGNTFILTNNHICELADEANALLIDESYLSTIVARYGKHDLCLITSPVIKHGLKVAAKVRDGENIYVVGHPLLDPKSLTKGQLSGRIKIQLMVGTDIECKGDGFNQVDVSNTLIGSMFGVKTLCIRTLEANPVTANTLPGNSGSCVLNKDGELVGVDFAGIEGSGRGYIVPLDYIQDFLGGK